MEQTKVELTSLLDVRRRAYIFGYRSTAEREILPVPVKILMRCSEV